MSKITFLFPGQGAQYPTMGCDLYEESAAVKAIFEQASEFYGDNLYQLLKNSDAETLKQTQLAQMAITVVNISCFTLLKERGLKAEACAGFSLGEYSALYASGVLSLEHTLEAVIKRCQAMGAASLELEKQQQKAGMFAILGLESEKITETLKAFDKVFVANYNASSQTVIAGLYPQLQKAADLLLEEGAMKAVKLAVSGAFHTPLFTLAEQQLHPVLAALDFKNPCCEFYSGVNGERVTTAEKIRQLIQKQIVSAVQWCKLEESLSAASCTQLYEVGPGKVLAGLWRSHNRKIKVMAAASLKDLDQLEFVQ